MERDTIAAISTPPGNGGIGIIRVSGPEAAGTVDRIFASFRKSSKDKDIRTARQVVRMCAFTLRHGYIFDPETDSGDGDPELIDECLVSFMKGPRSYTGEDVVEINTHGGTAVMRRVLSLLFRYGVRPAEPGEFTKRAFMNGRIDLTRAEAVAELIRANTEESRKAAMEQMSGRLAETVNRHADMVEETLARLQVAIDYPEYDDEEQVAREALAALNETAGELRKLSRTYDRGRILREGLRTAICGRPNAGKSSLLNALLGSERAIVTDIPGTTRDTIEEAMDVAGYPVILTDTAGLREAEDAVEKIGVERAREELRRADLILFIADPAFSAGDEVSLLEETVREIPGKEIIFAVNKTDLLAANAGIQYEKAVREALEKRGGGLTGRIREICLISVKRQGAEEIIRLLREYLEQRGAGCGGAILTGERHKMLTDKAIAAIDRAAGAASSGMPLDIVASDLWECAGALGEITGRNVTEDVVDAIFSKFCLGK